MPLLNASWMVASHYKPGEVGKGEWGSLPHNPPWAVDAWGLGCLLQVGPYPEVCCRVVTRVRLLCRSVRATRISFSHRTPLLHRCSALTVQPGPAPHP